MCVWYVLKTCAFMKHKKKTNEQLFLYSFLFSFSNTKYNPNTQQCLGQLVRRAWNTVAQTVIQDYLNHARNGCNQIIDNNGWESSE